MIFGHCWGLEELTVDPEARQGGVERGGASPPRPANEDVGDHFSVR